MQGFKREIKKALLVLRAFNNDKEIIPFRE
jgi:hypothetical protein